MNEVFIKYLAITSGIVFPIAILIGIVVFIYKNNFETLIKKLISIVDYAIDKIEGDLKNLVKFCIEQAQNLINTVLNQSLNVYILMQAYDVIKNPPHGWAEILVSVIPFFIVIKKGEVDLNLNKIIDKFPIDKINHQKNEDTNKQD